MPTAQADILNFRNAPVYRREANDWYVEPSWAVDALLDAEPFKGSVLDPACGRGTIPVAFLKRGFKHVIGADIVDRGAGERGISFVFEDFLAEGSRAASRADGMPSRADNVVCNPPFKNAEAFARRALKVARDKVAMLLPLAFLESEGRLALWRQTPLSRVHVFGKRVSMPPGHLAVRGKATGGKVPFAWFVWERGYEGEPRLNWLARPAVLEPPIWESLGTEIFVRGRAGKHCGSDYLRTLGYADAVILEHLPKAIDYARRLALAADPERLRQGVG